MSKKIGAFLQIVGLLPLLVVTVGFSGLNLYNLFTGQTSSSEISDTFVGGLVLMASFMGMHSLLLIVVGCALGKRDDQSTFFSHQYIDRLAQLVIVPLCLLVLIPLAFVSVPLAIYFFYQYKKGKVGGVIRFTKWALKDWRITVPWYISLVTIVTILMLLME